MLEPISDSSGHRPRRAGLTALSPLLPSAAGPARLSARLPRRPASIDSPRRSRLSLPLPLRLPLSPAASGVDRQSISMTSPVIDSTPAGQPAAGRRHQSRDRTADASAGLRGGEVVTGQPPARLRELQVCRVCLCVIGDGVGGGGGGGRSVRSPHSPSPLQRPTEPDKAKRGSQPVQ